MAERTAATIMREMTQTKAAPIKDHIKQRILADLEAELESMYRPSTQSSLPGFGEAPRGDTAPPPVTKKG